MWQQKIRSRDDSGVFEGIDDITEFDTPPSSPETIFDKFDDDDVSQFDTIEQEPREKRDVGYARMSKQDDTIELPKNTLQNPAEAVVLYMAFYAIKRHKEMEDEILGIRERTGKDEKKHYRDFLHFYLSVRSQKPGLGNESPQSSDEKEEEQEGDSSRNFMNPPGFIPELIRGSTAVDSWLGLTVELLETLKELVILQREFNSQGNQNKKGSKSLTHIADDPQLPICEVLFSFLMEISRSPNVKVHLQIRDTTDTASPSLSSMDKREVRDCFAVAPPRCPVCPQLANARLCCVRYTLPKTSRGTSSGVFSRRSPGLKLPPPMIRDKDIDTDFSNEPLEEGSSCLPKLPPHFFISSGYAEKIESFWACENIHNIIAREAFTWCNIKSMSAAKGGKEKREEWFSKSIVSRLKLFQRTQGKSLVSMWDKHLKKLYSFWEEFKEFLDRLYDVSFPF